LDRSAAGSQSLAVDRVGQLSQQLAADLLVACGLVGVVADDEAVAHRAVVDDDLDAQVVSDGVVAALRLRVVRRK